MESLTQMTNFEIPDEPWYVSVGFAIAILSFISSLVLDKEKRKGILFFSLTSVGFLLVTLQVKQNHQSEVNKIQLLREIQSISTSTHSKVSNIQELLSQVLENVNPNDVGVELVVRDSLETIKSFDKEGADVWPEYKEWLLTHSGTKSIDFYIGDEHSYNFSLILLYLMTSPNNQGFVENQLPDWSTFPGENHWPEILQSDPLCQYVVFRNSTGDQILGFAETRELLKDLSKLESRKDEFTSSFRDQSTFLTFAERDLESFERSVSGDGLEIIAKNMIANDQLRTINHINQGTYFFQLSKLLIAE